VSLYSLNILFFVQYNPNNLSLSNRIYATTQRTAFKPPLRGSLRNGNVCLSVRLSSQMCATASECGCCHLWLATSLLHRPLPQTPPPWKLCLCWRYTCGIHKCATLVKSITDESDSPAQKISISDMPLKNIKQLIKQTISHSFVRP